MKPKSEDGVVDRYLNVYGTQNLKIAGEPDNWSYMLTIDLSICPGNVGANTYSSALLIGEKAAMIIADELCINRP